MGVALTAGLVGELAGVEAAAVLQDEFEQRQQYRAAGIVLRAAHLVAHPPQASDDGLPLVGGHQQGLAAAVGEVAELLHLGLDVGAADEVGREEQPPAANARPLSALLVAAHLSGGHADERPRLVVVGGGAIDEATLQVVAQEDAIHVVAVHRVAHRRQFVVAHDAHQRVLRLGPHDGVVVRHAPDMMQFPCHCGCKGNEKTPNADRFSHF